jgi:hypothetical protein
MSRVSAPRRDRLPPPQTFRVMALKHKVRHAVQCKTGRAPVGPAVVLELYGAMTHEGFPAGFVFAVSASRRPLVTLGARLGSNSWIRIASLKRPIKREEAAQLRGAPSNSRWSRRRDGHPARRGSARALDGQFRKGNT